MRPHHRLLPLAGASFAVLLAAAACSSSSNGPASSVLGVQATPTTPASFGPETAEPTETPPLTITLGSTQDPTLGTYLTDPNGMTLYVFTADSPDQSTCTGTCAANWPPFLVAAGTVIDGPIGGTDAFGTITRADGTTQVTLNHQPLYYYAGDKAAGQTNGQGMNNLWYVATLDL
jgi:predicted lipoprotein with Yx(FWY)xxD motif